MRRLGSGGVGGVGGHAGSKGSSGTKQLLRVEKWAPKEELTQYVWESGEGADCIQILSLKYLVSRLAGA